jgi:hypothetical protein
VSARRVEWRGDLFASDLSAARARLAALPIVVRPFEHTVTVFLHADGWELGDVVRLRAYRNLSGISQQALDTLLNEGLSGKLQRKLSSGETVQLGEATLLRRPSGMRPSCRVDGRAYVAGSLRVSRRVHHTYAPPSDAEIEARRVTVDVTRHVFRFADDGVLRLLGAMGPRIEVKGPAEVEVELMRRSIDPAGVLKRMPYSGVELLFQDLLAERVRPSTGPEVEAKLDVIGELRHTEILAALTSLPGVAMLLPRPHGVVRMRRYHVCVDQTSSDECTVVETASGRLSAKRKRHLRIAGLVLVRDTVASRTTDRDGSTLPLDRFLRDQSWIRVNTFQKAQTKIPFALPSGNAYLMSIDRCADTKGRRMQQVELEFIGVVKGTARAVGSVQQELETLVVRLVGTAPGSRLIPSTRSKYAMFTTSSARQGGVEHGVESGALGSQAVLER